MGNTMFQQLELFLAAARCGSINLAAEQCFISQQALRASVNSLENKLGFRLFTRSVRGVHLTREGEQVFRDAQRIVEIADGWKQFAREKTAVSGAVRIVASTIVCNSVLTDILLECRKRYPEINLQLYEAREDALLGFMSQRTIGVLGSVPLEVIRHKIKPFAEQRGLLFETFADDQFCVFLNTENALSRKAGLHTADLNTLELAIYPEEEHHFYYHDIYRRFSPVTPYHIERQESIFQLISENKSVGAVFPHLAVINNPYVRSGQVAALPVLDYPMPGISCSLFPAASAMTPAEKLVSDLLRERLNSLAGQLAVSHSGRRG